MTSKFHCFGPGFFAGFFTGFFKVGLPSGFFGYVPGCPNPGHQGAAYKHDDGKFHVSYLCCL